MTYQKCPICEGSGKDLASVRCPTCNGTRIIHDVTGLPPANYTIKSTVATNSYIISSEILNQVLEIQCDVADRKTGIVTPDMVCKRENQIEGNSWVLDDAIRAGARILKVKCRRSGSVWSLGDETSHGTIDRFQFSSGDVYAGFKEPNPNYEIAQIACLDPIKPAEH